MNYFKQYQKLVDKRNTTVLESDYEVHHIVPRCMGGSDDQSNLVKLSYREHLIAHMFLTRMYPDVLGLHYAVFCMARKMNSRSYDTVKRAYLEQHRNRTLGMWQDEDYLAKQSFRQTDEFRAYMSAKMKSVYEASPDIIERQKETRRTGDYSSSYGDEWKQKISDANKGVKKPEGFGEKISKAHTGRVITDDWRSKISKSKIGTATGDANAMASEANRAKVAQSKIGRKMVNVNGTRRYLKAEEYELIKDDIKIVDGKLYYGS